jgi:hypothetical protein
MKKRCFLEFIVFGRKERKGGIPKPTFTSFDQLRHTHTSFCFLSSTKKSLNKFLILFNNYDDDE